MKNKLNLSEKDFEDIKLEVQKAESLISGEIVPILIEQSNDYYESYFKVLSFGSFLALIIISITNYFFPEYAVFDPIYLLLISFIFSSLLASLFFFSKPLKRLVVDKKRMDESCWQKANEAFLEYEIFNTRDRTGILIFVSLFEHKIIIKADSGIAKVVSQKTWQEIADSMAIKIKEGKLKEAYIETIQKCAKLLIDNGFQIKPDDKNELRDDLQIKNS
jgi:putative membrane protein